MKLIQSDSKYFHNVTKNVYSLIKCCSFLSKNPEKKTNGFLKNVKQHDCFQNYMIRDVTKFAY